MSDHRTELESIAAEQSADELATRPSLQHSRCALYDTDFFTETGSSSTLGDDFPKQQERCRELLGRYRRLAADGAFGATLIEQTLREADAAAISGDLVAMIRAYRKMKEHE